MGKHWYNPLSWFDSGGGEDPRKFTPLPVAQSPLPNAGSGLPTASGSSHLTSAQQSQLQNALSAAGIWGTIQNLGGDVWGVVEKLLPKNADGSIDWGGALKDVTGWVKDNAKGILDAASAYNQYQRQQQADKWTKEALDLAKSSYADKAPLRVAGQAGMLNPQQNAPDLSSLKSSIPTPTVAPLPVAGSKTNLNNAQGIAAGGSANPFAPKSPAMPLPVAPTSTPSLPSGGAGYPGAPTQTPTRGFTPTTPKPLPVAPGTPQNPQMPAHYLVNGLDQDANGNATPGGYNALSDLYKQLGTTPGSVGDPRILALAKSNPKLIDALPVADAETLRRTMASVGA